jgi:hypothetical protein
LALSDHQHNKKKIKSFLQPFFNLHFNTVIYIF